MSDISPFQPAPEIFRDRCIKSGDQMLGSLLRCHPERAVTPKNPLPPVTIVEPAVVQEVVQAAEPEKPKPPVHTTVQIIALPTMSNMEHVKHRNPSVQLIIAEVAAFYELTVLALKSFRRTSDLVIPRQVAMYLCRELTPFSLPQIARGFSHRDHTTIMHGAMKIKNLMECDQRLHDEVMVITLRIADRLNEQSAA